jgi:hypothetical protein
MDTVPSIANMKNALEPIMGAEFCKGLGEFVKEEEVKKKLLDNTAEALKLGAFGMPWIKAVNGDETEVFEALTLGVLWK